MMKWSPRSVVEIDVLGVVVRYISTVFSVLLNRVMMVSWMVIGHL